MATLRIYLTGPLCLESGTHVVTARDLPGRQGRLALAYLLTNRHRPVMRDELVSVLWSEHSPTEVEGALHALLSKLRTRVKDVGSPASGLDVQGGAVSVRLPADTWVDVEECANALDEAEGALRLGDDARAWSFANVAVAIARRPFLPDETAPWTEAFRHLSAARLVRGLVCLSTVSGSNGEEPLAVQYAEEVVRIEPFRETGYQNLMRLHAQMGNRAEALRVFGACRQLLRDELGASPSPATEAVFLEILQSE